LKYPFFARILALWQALKSTNLTIRMASLHYIAAMRMVGLVELIARHGANIRAKSLIVSKKTNLIIAHLCSEMAVSCQNSYLPAW
jgi:hypothetical protein